MKLNFKKPFVDLDGNDISESDQGRTLASALSQSLDPKEGDLIKYWEWAQKCHKGEELDLDTADRKKVREFIEKSNFNVLVKAQLLSTMDDGGEPKKGGGNT
jgi:hypothetical protein